MEGVIVLFVGFILLGIVLGSFLGLIAFSRVSSLQARATRLENAVRKLHGELKELKATGAPPLAEQPALEPPPVQDPAKPAPEPTEQAAPEEAPKTPAPSIGPSLIPPTATRHEPVAPPREKKLVAARSAMSLEQTLGTRWLAYAGVLALLVGAVLFLKLAIDNNLIGPRGRIAVGCAAGLGALGLGEYFRRKDYAALFQTLTGGGIGVFYLCIYFAVRVYELAPPGAAFFLAILVTGLGVSMAVAYNALPIACLAVIGGFMSPVMVSQGGNQPYILFTYIAILDLTAMGAALYRRWPILDIMCFIGSAILFQAWYANVDAAENQTPAILYAIVFYLVFLLTPILFSLYRKAAQRVDGLVLIVINSVYTTLVLWQILFEVNRLGLGYLLLAQGVVTFGLFHVWTRRVAPDNTAQSLLTLSLALVTLVIPVILRGDALPIAWAIEGTLLVHLGARFRNELTRFFGFAAGCFSVIAYVGRLPAHELPAYPLFNTTFGTGAFIIAGLLLSGRAFLRHARAHGETTKPPNMDWPLGILFLAAGYVATTFLLSIEIINNWRASEHPMADVHTFTCLVVLWAVIAGVTVTVISRRGLPKVVHAATAFAYVLGIFAVLIGFAEYDSPSALPFVSLVFATRVLFIAVMLYGARVLRNDGIKPAGDALEGVVQFLLAILLFVEMDRWSDATEAVSDNFALACVSALWAVQACALIWWGLASREAIRRFFGFGLFAITLLKVTIIDAQELSQGFRILTFMAAGALLLAAAFIYQRFSAVFLADDEAPTDERATDE